MEATHGNRGLIFLAPADVAGLEPTLSMAGGSNNYLPGAPVVDRIGKGGFWMTGSGRRTGDGAPLAGQRIQIWAHTTEAYENDLRSHGATPTDANGVFRLRCRRSSLPSANRMAISFMTAVLSRLSFCVP